MWQVKRNTWWRSSSGSRCNITPQLFLWCLECKYFLCPLNVQLQKIRRAVVHVTGPPHVLQRLPVCQVFWHGGFTKIHKLQVKRLNGSKLSRTHQISRLFLYTIPEVIFHSSPSYCSLHEWAEPAGVEVKGNSTEWHKRSRFRETMSPLKWCLHGQLQLKIVTATASSSVRLNVGTALLWAEC